MSIRARPRTQHNKELILSLPKMGVALESQLFLAATHGPMRPFAHPNRRQQRTAHWRAREAEARTSLSGGFTLGCWLALRGRGGGGRRHAVGGGLSSGLGVPIHVPIAGQRRVVCPEGPARGMACTRHAKFFPQSLKNCEGAVAGLVRIGR